MDTVIGYICIPLGLLMKWCWMLVSDYALAILLFTLAGECKQRYQKAQEKRRYSCVDIFHNSSV